MGDNYLWSDVMDWNTYRELYEKKAIEKKIPLEKIKLKLEYAEKLFLNELPIIYNAYHLSNLVGISHEYLFKISNSPNSGYRKFKIDKKNGGTRTINEPLPNLKIVQNWILREILENISVSPYAKAYKKGVNIKSNVRFHKKQKLVFHLDIKDFFINLKQHKVLSLFLKLGYSKEVSVLLAKLCTLNNSLPQGAPTSAYLSNVLLGNFDNSISKLCNSKHIRYTRYADDMNFSGDFNYKKLQYRVVQELSNLGLELNEEKTTLMKKNQRQIVTGIVVNEKVQVPNNMRKQLRKEVYFIQKYGIKSHIQHTNMDTTEDYYLKSLLSRIGYCIFINPEEKELIKYHDYIKKIITVSNDN